MNVKEESACAGLQIKVKKTKVMTAEKLYNINDEKEDIEILKYRKVLHLLFHPSIQMGRLQQRNQKTENWKSRHSSNTYPSPHLGHLDLFY